MAEKNAGDTHSTLSRQFTDIAQDLFNIEVNIILRDNITAQKMPTPRHRAIAYSNSSENQV